MAKEQPFRSIEMRGRQSSVRSDLQAPDTTRQMAAAARNEMQQLQASHEALNASKRFQNFNEQVLEERAIEQQRLEAANLSTNTQILLLRACIVVDPRGKKLHWKTGDRGNGVGLSYKLLVNLLVFFVQVQPLGEAGTVHPVVFS